MDRGLFILAGGVLLLALIVINILIGKRVIKAGIKMHVALGWGILALGLLHASIGILGYLDLLPY